MKYKEMRKFAFYVLPTEYDEMGQEVFCCEPRGQIIPKEWLEGNLPYDYRLTLKMQPYGKVIKWRHHKEQP